MSKPIFKKISIILFFTIDIGWREPSFNNWTGFDKSSKFSTVEFDEKLFFDSSYILLASIFSSFIC